MAAAVALGGTAGFLAGGRAGGTDDWICDMCMSHNNGKDVCEICEMEREHADEPAEEKGGYFTVSGAEGKEFRDATFYI